MVFASDCHFAAAVVELLAPSRLSVRAIVLPGHPALDGPLEVRRSPGPLMLAAIDRQSLETLAGRHQIPVYRAGNLDSTDWRDLLRGLEPAILLSVCYPRRIPAGIIDAVNGRALNVHPSLLPDLRGPDPLFWTFRRATGETGLTLHLLNEAFDAGPIVAQRNATFEPGTREVDLERMHASMTSEMLADLLPALASGDIHGIAQDNRHATWAPHPGAADYVIDRTWTARGAFTFIRGIEDRGHPVTLVDGDMVTVIRRVHGYSRGHRPEDVGHMHSVIECCDGYVIAETLPASTNAHDGEHV